MNSYFRIRFPNTNVLVIKVPLKPKYCGANCKRIRGANSRDSPGEDEVIIIMRLIFFNENIMEAEEKSFKKQLDMLKQQS